MSSGKTHLLCNLIFSTALVLTVKVTHFPLTEGQCAGLITGLFLGTFLISPDLDLGRTRTVTLQAWGPLWFIWWPVLRLSRHRGRSHTWLRGPLFRLAYLGILFELLLLLPFIPTNWTDALRRSWSAVFLFLLIGYLPTQWSHLLLDRIPLRWNRL